MKLIHDSAPCLHLLLLAELFVHSSSRTSHTSSLCSMLKLMMAQVDRLKNLSKSFHDLSDVELLNFADMEHRLHSLPHIHHTATHLSSLKVNESLSQLYVHAQAFKLHVDWLKTAKENVSLSSHSAEGAGTHLLQLSNLLNSSLHQMSEEAPLSPPPSLPVTSTAFDVLRFSVEISERLQVFCDWSKRVLRQLQRLSHCPRH
uniref:Interleukin 11a n=1 Tax=Monopterus albus TaxID=43700 RepID=A0A3Q3Q838_MONAL